MIYVLSLLLFLSDSYVKQMGVKTMNFSINSTAFSEGERIPDRYTCEGEDISPPLSWSNLPEGVHSLALISDDPDAPVGTWDHWVIYNIPADSNGLTEAVPPNESLADDAKQGLNSWGRTGYGGPCPPPGSPHRYFFKLYALDTILALPADEDKSSVENAMRGHILAEAQLMGTYSR